MFDLVLANARIDGASEPLDIGIARGRIEALERGLAGRGPTIALSGRYAFPGFVETHIHLDKAGILGRCPICEGTLSEAIALSAAAKPGFTEADVFERASRVLERAIGHGTTLLRTFVEVDPRAGLRSLAAILRLRETYASLIEIEICAFAQEGLTQEMETYALLEAALEQGADLVGGCPYTDPDPARHVTLIFDLAQKYDVAVDFHIDFDLRPEASNLGPVIAETHRRGYQGRVSIGHATSLSALPPEALAGLSGRLAEAGIALTVLPATDLYINGRDSTHLVPRGVAPAHAMAGMTRAIATNNVLNPFTPFGDASLLRMANLYANLAQLGGDAALADVFGMVGAEAARLMGRSYGLAPGGPATLVVLDAPDAITALRELAQPLAGWKDGHQTFRRPTPEVYLDGAGITPVNSL
ncbi:amidohydrolase [Arsenicitalea aurantiaca]|uniref:Amidohydrolase n=1 Tax=Arsenicitalea aurantiaca TaxID=1783274 RepID=A0A433XBG0_9HYPH|nr:amidohydrolase family protein [Arsenicitalea aurantiaca]RUT31415.1 amidohydrolase [Arsenicitalea aurantiaca]